MKIPYLLSVTLLSLFFTSIGANAATVVYGEAAPWSGSRNTDGGGLLGGGKYAADQGPGGTDFTVSWNITDNLNGTLNYEYTFTNLTKDISHIVVDLSDDCGSACVQNAQLNGGDIDPLDIEIGNNDGITGGVKFDVGGEDVVIGDPLVYSFDSNRVAVWGHLAVKDGGNSTCAPGYDLADTFACSNGLVGGSMEEILNFIAVPDTDTVGQPVPGIPLPAAAWLFGSALLGLVVARRRRIA